jgi:tetratricopeptide (TPR) repeat protein
LHRLPKSRLLETRAIEVLEAEGDLEGLANLLTDRLELEPDRPDLRFRLVKAGYALRRDAAAEQDFRTVVAGLDPKAVSERLLELQRYLRGIERLDAAAGYLEQYVRNHPARLDVARELAEVRLSAGATDSVAELVRMVSAEEA